MTIADIEWLPTIQWKGELIKGKISSYKLSAYAVGYGEIGLFIVQIKNNIWKSYYIFVDRDWPDKKLRKLLICKMKKIAVIRNGELNVA